MDEPSDFEVFEREVGVEMPFKLPNSGALTLSQIRAEFNKGNDLSKYYGAASGVPSSGALAFSDFYGKEDGSGTPAFAPEGTYKEPVANITSRPSEYYHWSARGTGLGSYYPMPDSGGVTGLTELGNYNDLSKQRYRFALLGMTEAAFEYYEQYRQIKLYINGQNLYYPGNWAYFERSWVGNPIQTVTEFDNEEAGLKIAECLNTKREWKVSLVA